MHEDNALKSALAQLGGDTLAGFIAGLYGADSRLDQRIDRLLLSQDTGALVKALKKQLSSLKRRRSFVDYYQAESFADELEQLLSEIKQLIPTAPTQGFALVDTYLKTAPGSLDRCDDSNGFVGEVYRQACVLWLQAASQCPPGSENWVERVKQLAAANDYGVLDPLLPNAQLLLTGDELRQLAFYYETGLRKELARDPDGISYLRWSVNMEGVAEALKDPVLYRRATLLVNPTPNYQQQKNLAEFCMRCDAWEAALEWLTEPWQSSAWSNPNIGRLSLLADCYKALNRPQQQLEALKARLAISPIFEHLQAVLPLIPEAEAGIMRQRAIDLAMQEPVAEAKLKLLLQLEEYEAAETLAVSEMPGLAECYYGFLTSLLELAPADCLIIRVVLLRCLLNDILTRGKTPAYRYGARYLKELRKLDQQQPAYGRLPAHSVYEQQLSEQHGRKRSFWPLLEKE